MYVETVNMCLKWRWRMRDSSFSENISLNQIGKLILQIKFMFGLHTYANRNDLFKHLAISNS